MDESHSEKIARIDANVQMLVKVLPKVQELDKDSAVNKTQHKMIVSILLTPIIYWVCHKLGVEFF
jgi:hypothetical protein